MRYFDVDKCRPGLPEDVAALVTGLSAESAELTLVNLNPDERRQVLIAAGSFGEHQFETVSVNEKEDDVDVGGAYLQIDMRPGTRIDLRLAMNRFCNKPNYAFPWAGASS